MPQPGQVIPYWLHPHTQTIINDNTEFVEQVASSEEFVRSLFIFTSPKGRDGQILDFRDHVSWEDEYGKPDFKLYGQPAYMPYNALKTGVVKAWCMRVMPDDATYSNLIIVAKVKVENGPIATPTPKLVVRFEAHFHSDIKTKEEIDQLTELMIDEDPDADGFMTYPIMVFYSQGRGAYGNAFRVRLVQAIQADRDTGFKNYRVEIYELINSLKRKELFEVSLYPDALVGNTSIFAPDVLEDSDRGSKKLGVSVLTHCIENIFNLYKEQVDPSTTLDLKTFDLLIGKDMDGRNLPGIIYDTTHPDYVALDMVEGIPLSGGDDGSFKLNPDDPSIRESAIDEAYIKAFRGDFDKAVLSKRMTPSEYILDAGYSEDVKKQLINLIIKRGDAHGFIDAGILHTHTDAIAWGESMKSFGDRIISKEFQHFKTRDPFSGRPIPVTITYFYTTALPLHIIRNGIHVPFTGANNATLTGAIKNTLRPLVDADDLEAKEQLYLLRLNYFQTIAENTFVRGTQSTSQNIWSDLTEENNMRVLLEAKRKIEEMVSALTYNFAEKEDQRRFKEDAARLFANDVGVKFRSFEIEFGMNPWEEERSILHCYLALVFRTMAKRNIIEIDINKRV